MTDETPTPNPASAEPSHGAVPEPEARPVPDASTAEAWNDVVARMSELGAALSAWARSAADDPQNRQRLEQLRAGVDEMARQADSAFGRVASTDFGQQFTQSAQQAGDALGDAAQQVSEAAAPHVATALSGLASMFGKAAAKVDEAVNRERPAGAAPEAAPAPPSPPTSDEPPSGDDAT